MNRLLEEMNEQSRIRCLKNNVRKYKALRIVLTAYLMLQFYIELWIWGKHRTEQKKRVAQLSGGLVSKQEQIIQAKFFYKLFSIVSVGINGLYYFFGVIGLWFTKLEYIECCIFVSLCGLVFGIMEIYIEQ